MQTEILGINRVTGNEIPVQADEAGDLLVAHGAADYEDATRSGKRFIMRNTTPIAGVTAIPTQAFNCAFTNSDPDGGRSMIIDAIFSMQSGIASAALDQVGMIWLLTQTREAVLTDAVLIPRKLNGVGASSDTCCFISIPAEALEAIGGVAPGWMPVGNSVITAVTTLYGMALWAEVNGRIIVPPGRVLALHMMVSETTPTFNMGIMWHEKQITLA